MYKLTHIFTIIIAVLIISSCGNEKKEECARLDASIGAINDTLLNYGQKWGEELEIAVNTLDFSELPATRLDLQSYIDRKIEYVEGLEPIGGADSLIAAELEFLKVERQIIANKFSAFEAFNDSVTMEELTAAYVEVQKSASQEQKHLEAVYKLRETYAEKNDFPKYIDKY